MALAEGLKPDAAQSRIGQVAEGVRTAAAAHAMAQTLKVDVPLMEAVNLVLQNRLAAATAVSRLMARPERSEF